MLSSSAAVASSLPLVQRAMFPAPTRMKAPGGAAVLGAIGPDGYGLSRSVSRQAATAALATTVSNHRARRNMGRYPSRAGREIVSSAQQHKPCEGRSRCNWGFLLGLWRKTAGPSAAARRHGA